MKKKVKQSVILMGDHCFKVDTNEEFNNITPMQIQEMTPIVKRRGKSV